MSNVLVCTWTFESFVILILSTAAIYVLNLKVFGWFYSLQVFQILKTLFGPKMTSHLIVIFAGKDQLEKTGVDFEQQVPLSYSKMSVAMTCYPMKKR